MEVTFPVFISNGGYIEVDCDLSDEEYELLMSYKQKYDDLEEDAEEFWEVEALSKLYESIRENTLDEMANGMYEPDSNFDFDETRKYIAEHFNVTLDYPEEM